MPDLVQGEVRVTVPATSANLGPGYDSLGLALTLRDELVAGVAGAGLTIEVSGAGADDVPRDESHLVVRAMRVAFAALDVEPPGLHLSCTNLIPHARGLGSSSAAIVGGLVLARGLVAGGPDLLDDRALLQLAAQIEGHPDNVAPALYGGFVISGREGEEFYAVPSPVVPIRAVVFVPPDPVSTELARGLLPASVPHAAAAANAGRTALLVAALAGETGHLLAATRDLLHQDYRRPAMPATLDLVRALRHQGVPAVVSGAGPTVLAFVEDPATAPGLLAATPAGWESQVLTVDPAGAQVG